MFRHFLARCRDRLKLPTTSQAAGRKPARPPPPAHDGWDVQKAAAAQGAFARFTAFIRKGLTLGLASEMEALLEESCAEFIDKEPRRPKPCGPDITTHYETLLLGLTRLVGPPEPGTALPLSLPPTPAVQQLARSLLLDFILPKQGPTYPERLPGWAHRRIDCPYRACQDCALLNAFVRSETEQVGRFTMVQKRRAHLEGQLAAELYAWDTDRQPGSKALTLVVTKRGTEHDVLVQQADRALATRQATVGKFCGEGLRLLLGDEEYRSIVLMEGYKRERERAVAGGVKREAPAEEGERRLARRVRS